MYLKLLFLAPRVRSWGRLAPVRCRAPDKSAATGIGYEPWHYRYVGKEAASAVTESGLCFEEWLEEHLPDLSQ